MPSTTTSLAREALLDIAPGEHVGGELESVEVEPGVVTNAFECLNPAYPGWYWAVTLVTLDGHTTVSEANLLPGAGAVVPPPWRPWSERIESGDLGVGDLLAPAQDDDRLTAGFTDVPLEQSDEFSGTQWELGLGREQILSVAGLDRAVHRWLDGQTGPRAAMAKAAPADCATCGFLVAIGGSLGQAFGICGNEYGAADGKLVAMSFGCGAHSSVRVDHLPPVPVVGLVVDDAGDDVADASDVPDYDPAVDQAPAAFNESAGDDADDHDDEPDISGARGAQDDDSDDDIDIEDDPDDDGQDRQSDLLEHIDEDSLDWNPRHDL